MFENNIEERGEEMDYIAHKQETRVQTVKEHLVGTAQLAREFAEKFGKEEWGYCCGLLHDIGKYSDEFQRKITGDTEERVDHSTAGAQLCNELGGYYQILSYCIAGHHAGLPDYGNTAINTSLCGRLSKKVCSYQSYKKELEIPKLQTDPIVMKENSNMDFALGTFIRMLYSCLVDADFLDTETFMKNGRTGREAGQSIEELWTKLEKYVSNWLDNKEIDTINGRRTEILKNCMNEGKHAKGMFRLTVPTGGGKTIASLAFALKHAVFNHMDRIIYVIPYTSIIEQNAQVFREILGEENVLENHCNVEYKATEELNPMQLASENWDKPVVVTTNVQFFESLFANKSSKCRKIHNIANSVVVLDEAQMLSLDYLKPCMAMLQELVDNYAASIVLCTATQPALDSLFPERRKVIELCPRMEEQFQFFERVNYQKLGIISRENLIERLRKENCVLCIMNTKKLAQEVFQKLEGDGIYHLSTSMYPKHRKKVLKRIREKLDKKEKCIVISTSLVEAGVDLDFQNVYRQLNGIDSMIQAAGRCNREGKADKKESNVYIFDLEDEKTSQNQKLSIDVARGILEDYEKIDDLNAIKGYFEQLYHFRGASLDKKHIMDEYKQIKCNFAEIAKKFKLIEQETKMIFIHKESEAEELFWEIQQKGYSKERMRKAGQYCVQVYANAQNGNSYFEKLQNAGLIRPMSEDMQDFYELTAEEEYSEKYGLNLGIDGEMALFL